MALATHLQNQTCANNCGFFGTYENRNLCSKCYRELFIQVEVAATTSPAVLAAPAPSPGAAGPSKAANRCESCNKKVGLTGFVCKCGATLCGIHRYPEKHQCTFDFKVAGRQAISKANPVVQAHKVDPF